MDLPLFLAFVAATATLSIIPGPNMALIVSTSISQGTRFGLLALLGTTTAMVLQLVLVGVGLSAVLATAGRWFEVLRWLGALYLVWIGVQSWRAPPPTVDPGVVPGPARGRSARRTVLRGLAVSLTNPKALLFFGAFFPQFLVPGRSLLGQVALLSVTFVAVVAVLDGLWAVLAGRMRRWIARRGRLLNRTSGALLIGAGAGLALVRSR